MIAAVERMEAARKAEDVAREVRVSAHTIPARKSRYCGTATAGVDNGLALSWTYDLYGNRWAQTASGSGNASAVQPNLSFTGNNNRVDGWSYDADGNLLNDQRNIYTYDAEGRIIKLNGNPTYTYDAEGRRVAKLGSGGAVTTSYLLDLAGNQLTELNASGAWTHSNVWAGGRLLATYDTSAGTDTVGYHFHLTDWLGTQRMQTTAAGNQEEVCYSYPFGDGLTCTGTADSTENHFTSKERDAESGLDYFGARYLSSDLGRFMTPDWAAKPTAVPYATFGNPQTVNLYLYVQDNPTTGLDPDGHCCDITGMMVAVVQFVEAHPAIPAAITKIAGSFSAKVNGGAGLEESIGQSGFKVSGAASATGFAQLSKNGVTTGSDLKLGASIETPMTGKLSVGGTSETISKENGTELAPPGRTETSSETGIGNFTDDGKTFGFGNETGAGPDIGVEVDVDKSEFSQGLSDLGGALLNALPDAVTALINTVTQSTSPEPPSMPTENPAIPPPLPNLNQ